MKESRQSSVVSRQAPASVSEFAEQLSAAASEGAAVQFLGGGTKAGWGAAAPEGAVEMSTLGLGRLVEHNAGDLTAVVEAGVRLGELQDAVAAEGQMFALDPPLGEGRAATLGGVVAAGDSGPLRHRYGSPRDLVVGVTVALSDGTVAQAGGKVIKNVAGYDLAKLLTGSYGTLGAILGLSLRLHPLPASTATAVGRSSDPGALAAAASELSHARIELQSLDIRWEDGAGAVLARFGGRESQAPADDAARTMTAHGLEAGVDTDDGELWDAQRAGQRSDGGTSVRVSGLQTQLPALLAAAQRLEGRVVARAGLGLSWVTLPEGANAAAAVEDLRRQLAPSPCVVLDAPAEVRAAVDVWGERDPGELALMRRVKQRFDPAGACVSRGLV